MKSWHLNKINEMNIWKLQAHDFLFEFGFGVDFAALEILGFLKKISLHKKTVTNFLNFQI
jgi:hypothetical protein